jgi:Holliday junction DNA helicase RuvA
MIARLRGQAAGRSGDGMILDVGGVGYLVHATPRAMRLGEAGAEMTVEIYTHVREDTLALYGFAEAEERELFVHLLSVTGIGPKVALAIVSGSTPGDLRRAIALDDTARFEAIPGIGKKTAQRVVLELKEKLGSGPIAPVAPGEPSSAAGQHVVARDALVELGYSLVEAEAALAAVDPDLPANERVRLVLRSAAA